MESGHSLGEVLKSIVFVQCLRIRAFLFDRLKHQTKMKRRGKQMEPLMAEAVRRRSHSQQMP